MVLDNDFHAPGSGFAWLAEYSKNSKPIKIGRGCFIGAGSVVTKDVPAFSVAAGNPARIVGSIATP
jgi:acetyltransferase-like isoleucine patch superfamily enzyme